MSERITVNTAEEWDALTPEQKRAFVEQSVEDSYRNAREMAALGEAIRKGVAP